MVKSQDALILVIVPRKSVATSIVSDLRQTSKIIGVTLEYAQGSHSLDHKTGRIVRFIDAPQLLQAVGQRDPKIPISGVNLVILDHLEQIDAPYELGVSLLRHATQTSPVRFVGISHSLSDPADLAAWLDVDPFSLFSFQPSDRSQALAISAQTFTIPHSGSLFKAMAKPAHTAIKGSSSAVVFVPSRGQCRSIAFDLITQCALDSETDSGYLSAVSARDLEGYLAMLQDHTLVDIVSRGVGVFHEGIHRLDRKLMLELYVEGVLRVLIVPRESCWSLPVRCEVVVVMGTQYVHLDSAGDGSSRQLRDYELPELVQMQSRAVRHTGLGHFHLFCQGESKDTIMRFLRDGLPLESRLLETQHLQSWYKYHHANGTLPDKQQIVDALSFTFLARRIETNPTYYDCTGTTRDENLSLIVDKLVLHDQDVPVPSS